jgi:hypothetical protein
MFGVCKSFNDLVSRPSMLSMVIPEVKARNITIEAMTTSFLH